MPPILHILKKDLRRLWPLLLAWWAVLALEAAYPALVLYSSSESLWAVGWGHSLNMIMIFLELGLLFMIATRLIESDLPLGDKVFWRTLPVTGHRMFAAKGLFALLFLILPVIVFALATRMLYGYPLSEWLEGLVPYAFAHVAVVVLALTVPSLFRRPFLAYVGLAAVAVGIMIAVGYLSDPVVWTMLGPRLLGLVLYAVLFAFMIIFMGGTFYLRDQPRFSGVLIVAAWALWCAMFGRLISGWDGRAYADLNTLRGELPWMPILVGGLAASLFMYCRLKRHQGALMVLVGLLMAVNLVIRWPAPDFVRSSGLELLHLPPGQTITASGYTIHANVTHGPLPPAGSDQTQTTSYIPEPGLRFESQSSGNSTIFAEDQPWNFDYENLIIRWPDSVKVDFRGYGHDVSETPTSGNLSAVIKSLMTGHKDLAATPPQTEMSFGLPYRPFVANSYSRLERESAVFEGTAVYTSGSFEKIADFPLVNGAAYSTGPNHSVLRSNSLTQRQIIMPRYRNLRDDPGPEWPILTMTVAMLSPRPVISLFYDDMNDSFKFANGPSLLFVLWNEKRQEYFLVGGSYEGMPSYEPVNFLENGATFNFSTFILEARLFVAPNSGQPGLLEPMTPEQAKAWLADARLLVYRYTPHTYYLPFKTAPFTLEQTPATP